MSASKKALLLLVSWQQERFQEITTKLGHFLKQAGFKVMFCICFVCVYERLFVCVCNCMLCTEAQIVCVCVRETVCVCVCVYMTVCVCVYLYVVYVLRDRVCVCERDCVCVCVWM